MSAPRGTILGSYCNRRADKGYERTRDQRRDAQILPKTIFCDAQNRERGELAVFLRGGVFQGTR
jgi:hypothetical protein